MRQYAIAVIAVATACTYQARDTCATADCSSGNGQAPVAVIDKVDTDGNLTVGAASDALIDGSKSSDPDGDPLTYAWTVDAACGATVVGDTTSAQIRLSGLKPGATCSIALSVADPGGLTGHTDANLVVINVGAFVTHDQGHCLQTFDASVTSAQGTPDHPFCTISQGVLVAKAYSLAEVSLDVGLHTLNALLTIDFPMTLRGGYASGAAAWPHDASAYSDIQLLQSTPGSDTSIVIANAGNAAIEDVAVYRLGPCITDCALVLVGSSAATVRHVNLGKSAANVVPPGSGLGGGHTVAGLSALAGADDTAVYPLTIDTVTIAPSVSGAAASLGLAVVGPFALVATAVHATVSNAALATGIRTLGVTSATLNNPTLTVSANNQPGSFAAGLADGDRDSISALGTNCGVSSVCGGSTSIAINGGNFTANNATVAAGILASGTQSLSIAPASITVTGVQAWGIALSAAGAGGTLDLGQVGVSVTTITDGVTPHPFGIAIGDNYIGSVDAPSLGSRSLSLHDSNLMVTVLGLGSETIAGVSLQHSSGVQLSNNRITLQATGMDPAGTLSFAAGIATYDTQHALIADTVITSNAKVTSAYAGFVDGTTSATSLTAGSHDLQIHRISMNGSVKAENQTTLLTQMAFSGSNALTVSNQYDLGLALSTAFQGPLAVYGMLLTNTKDATIRGTQIFTASITPDQPYGVGTFVGIHDGGLDQSSLSGGSDGLQITGNAIFVVQNGASLRGIELRGTPGSDTSGRPTLVDDNAINVLASETAIGIFTQSTNVTLAYNTVRVGYCAGPCAPGAYGVGWYTMHPSDFAQTALANSFNTVSPGGGSDTDGRPAIVWHTASDAYVPLKFSTTTDNMWGTESLGGDAAYVIAIIDSSLDVQVPTGSDPHYTASGGSSIPNSTNNVNLPASLCLDHIHGRTGGNQENAAKTVTQQFDFDINGESRSGTANVGADAHLQACP